MGLLIGSSCPTRLCLLKRQWQALGWNPAHPVGRRVSSFKEQNKKRAETSAPTRLARCILALIGPTRGLGPLSVGQLRGGVFKGIVELNEETEAGEK